MAPYVAEEVLPGPRVRTDADYEESFRANGISNLHPVGTCRKGAQGSAVVDPRLRVYGVERLRVVDAAVMPAVVAGNTNAPTIMIGEKAAAMILAEAKGER